MKWHHARTCIKGQRLKRVPKGKNNKDKWRGKRKKEGKKGEKRKKREGKKEKQEKGKVT